MAKEAIAAPKNVQCQGCKMIMPIDDAQSTLKEGERQHALPCKCGVTNWKYVVETGWKREPTP